MAPVISHPVGQQTSVRPTTACEIARQPATGWLKEDSIAGGVLIVLVLTGLQRLIGFVRSLLFCRWLEPDQLGQWDVAWGFLMLAAPLAVLSLPGTFGRYLEHYKAAGQLRVFLCRTAVVCLGLALVACGLLLAMPAAFCWIIFGSDAQQQLIAPLAGSLLAVIAYNYLISLFTSLRTMRLVAVLETVNSASFALAGGLLVCCWQRSAASAIVAYGAASLLCVVAATGWMQTIWRHAPQITPAIPQREFWAKLLPFAGWIMLVNLLTNLFSIADRYLIAQLAPGDSQSRLALVGQYHSARVLPLLLASLASMLAAMILPHLSRDWEAGSRQQVSRRMNLGLKLLGLSLTAASAVLLLGAPLLFRLAFAGKYQQGLDILPWTLLSGVWFGAAALAQMYLWCAERAGKACLATALGLAVSVVLNLLLLPRLGLQGVVLSAAAANLTMLAAVLWFSCRLGLRVDRGVWLALAAPAALCVSPAAALAVVAIVGWFSFWHQRHN